MSVVIPTYRRPRSVLRLLDTLSVQTLEPSQFEVIVVVDGLDDRGSLDALRCFEAPYVLRTLEREKRGRAATVNAGAAIARGEIVIVLDDDMEATPGLLLAHVREHERRGRVAVVGAAPIRVERTMGPFARFRAVRFNDVLERMAASDGLTFGETYTGNFSVRLTDFRAAGGYEEAFDRYGLEDYELALRLSNLGVALVYSSNAVAHQHYEKDFAAAALDQEARGWSIAVFRALHPSSAAKIEIKDLEPPSGARRVFRYVLPRMTRLAPFTRALVLRAVEAAERLDLRRLPFVYELGLEYFTLVGLDEASREHAGITSHRIE